VTVAADMVRTYSTDLCSIDQARLSACVEACLACAQACTACADACLSEDSATGPATWVRTKLDCADICVATAQVLSRHNGYDTNATRALLEACVRICKRCADECERHASTHAHCRVCAEQCRRCEQACRDLLIHL
jgi:hypothetical protein